MNQQISTKRARSSPSEKEPGGAQDICRGKFARDRTDPFPDLFAGNRRRSFAALIAAGLGQGVALAGMTLLMRVGLDRAFSGAMNADGTSQFAILGALAVCAAIAGLLKWYAHIEAERIGQSYAHALRMRLFRRLISAGEQPKEKRGAVLLRISGDLTPLRQWVSRGIAQLIIGGLAMMLGLAALASINVSVAAAVAATLAVAVILSTSLGGRLGAATADARRQRGKLANRTGEAIAEIDPNAEQPTERKARRLLRRLSRGVRDSLLDRAVYAGALRAIAESAGAFAGVAAMAVGVGLSARDELSPGSVMSAVFIAGVLAPHAHAMSRSFEYWTAAKVARKKQLELFERLSPRTSSTPK